MNTKRLKSLIEESGLTKIQISEKCGFTRVTLDKALQGADVKLSTIESLARVLNVDPSALFTEGEEKVLPRATKATPSKATEKCILNYTDLQQEEQGYSTYLLPISSRGGTLTGFAAPGTTLEHCEKIVSPIADVDFAISIYGESMSPEYPSGSTVLIKKVDPSLFIEWGKVFVLDTPNGVILKEVHQSSKEGYVTCHSINPDPKFADFDVPLREVYGMYRVLMCLSVK